jgi:hypothetical protein
MSRDINPFGLRMPPELRERLEASSKASGRSMNAELVARLEQSFRVPTSDGVRELVLAIVDERLEMEKRIQAMATQAKKSDLFAPDVQDLFPPTGPTQPHKVHKASGSPIPSLRSTGRPTEKKGGDE